MGRDVSFGVSTAPPPIFKLGTYELNNSSCSVGVWRCPTGPRVVFFRMDEHTKATVKKIPLLTVNAGPRDADLWVKRLKEEYAALIKVSAD